MQQKARLVLVLGSKVFSVVQADSKAYLVQMLLMELRLRLSRLRRARHQRLPQRRLRERVPQR